MINKTKTKEISNLLDKASIKSVIKTAKSQLKDGGELQPVIFLKLKKKKEFLLAPILIDTQSQKEKANYLAKMGNAVEASTKDEITEALMITDAYMLKLGKRKKIKDEDLPIRDNPARTECIIVVGRNKSRSKVVAGTFPYTRIDNRIIFQKEEATLEFSSKAKQKDLVTVGLVDYLFGSEEADLLHRAHGLDKEKATN